MTAPIVAGSAVLRSVVVGSAALVAIGAIDGLWRRGQARRVRSRLPAGAGHRGSLPPAPRWFATALARTGRTEDAGAVFRTWVTVCGCLALATPFAPASRILLAVAVVGPAIAFAAWRDRGRRRRLRQLPLALDAIGSGLRGGRSLSEAVAEASSGLQAPLGHELAEVHRLHRGGWRLSDALAAWRGAAVDADTAIAGSALELAAELGGPGARAVESAARSIRDRQAVGDEVASLATQARMSALVLTFAPIGFAVLLVSVDPTSAQFLLATPTGWACILGGLGLDALGAWWMQRLVRRSTR